MKDTAEQSAELKLALKHDPSSPALRAEARAHPLELDEACVEVERGLDDAHPASVVALLLSWYAADCPPTEQAAKRKN